MMEADLDVPDYWAQMTEDQRLEHLRDCVWEDREGWPSIMTRLKQLEDRDEKTKRELCELHATIRQLKFRLDMTEELAVQSLAARMRYRELNRRLINLESQQRKGWSPVTEWAIWLAERALRAHPWHPWWGPLLHRDYEPRRPDLQP